MKPLAFITGASSGIGQALAERYLALGYRVALCARRTEEVAAWAKTRQLAAQDYAIYAADVAQPDSIIAAARTSIEQQGLADVVVANAGISIGMDTSEREDLDVMAQTFATNNLGLAATFHPFIAPMRKRGSGTLVGIASVAAIRGLPGHGAYCASKAAVVAYCESLRGELRADGIAVVTICPGYVDTPLTRRNPYGMPFLMAPEAFAQAACAAIAAQSSYSVIPWQMAVVAKLLRLLPNPVFDRLMQGRGRKPRRGANGQ